jgi:hypothetical protein
MMSTGIIHPTHVSFPAIKRPHMDRGHKKIIRKLEWEHTANEKIDQSVNQIFFTICKHVPRTSNSEHPWQDNHVDRDTQK